MHTITQSRTNPAHSLSDLLEFILLIYLLLNVLVLTYTIYIFTGIHLPQ